MVKIKTLIELFDECQLENIIAPLSFKPEKIVFVGYKNIMNGTRRGMLENFFKVYGFDVKIEYEIVGRYDYEDIKRKLEHIIERNEDCAFDLTGGSELVLVAMGELAADKNLAVFQFDIANDRFVTVKNCDNIGEPEKVSLSIAENMVLNGAVIVKDENYYSWYITDEFERDVADIWDICKVNCGVWNRTSNMLSSFEQIGTIDGDLNVRVREFSIKAPYKLSDEIMNALSEKKLILNYTNRDGIISFRYKNAQVHRCITKAGNILEVYAYTCAKRINYDDTGYYDDIDTGVVADWDGVVRSRYSAVKDTSNEIDVMVMRGCVPVFISCKNGEVHKEALYELETVAKRLGGKYAKKILLSTYTNTGAESRQYLLQRAKDMGICVIGNIDKMESFEFISEFKRVVR